MACFCRNMAVLAGRLFGLAGFWVVSAGDVDESAGKGGEEHVCFEDFDARCGEKAVFGEDFGVEGGLDGPAGEGLSVHGLGL